MMCSLPKEHYTEDLLFKRHAYNVTRTVYQYLLSMFITTDDDFYGTKSKDDQLKTLIGRLKGT